LTPQAFPHVYHSKTAQRLDVTFDEYHQIVLVSGETTSYDNHILVEYSFVSAEKRDEFQGDVRGMTHVRAFDVDVVSSNLHSKRDRWNRISGMARLEKMNLWQSKNFPYHHSLSFLASATSGEQQEYPFLSFSSSKPVSQDSKEAKLTLGGRAESSSLPQPRRHSLNLRWPRRLSGHANELLHESPVSPSLLQPNDPSQLNYLSFHFTHKDEYNIFKVEFERAYNDDLIPTEPIDPHNRVELENTQAPVEMSADMDILELGNPWE
jgi:hypothetical protein